MPTTQKTQSVAWTQRSRASSKAESTVFQLMELVDVDAGERMLESRAVQALRKNAEDDPDRVRREGVYAALEATVKLAKVLGGYLPVRYYTNVQVE